ncbi:YopX family protein [Brevibacillus porteri]|uniref:YopX family protein n=1 Tax=Brevibacillus porteri TaxID=2126350 RepID=UPI003625249D
MKRKLKFRAWDEKRKTLFEVWSGYMPKGVARKNDFFIGFNSEGLEVSEYEGKGSWRIFPVMQSTGCKDKNGKEIYEGDIVRMTYDDEFLETTVRYDGCALCVDVPNGYDYDYTAFGWTDEDEIEVIGNVFENPELVEKAS